MNNIHPSGTFPHTRMRRNRQSETVRSLVKEHRLAIDDLIYPVFVRAGIGIQEPIASMPDIHRYSPDLLVKHLKYILSLGIQISTFLRDKACAILLH